MKDIVPKTNLAKKRDTIVSGIIESLEKIEDGLINSNDMLCKMLLIEGSEAWKSKNISSLLEEAQAELGDPDVSMSVDRSIYFHIAVKALSEEKKGSSVGLSNAQESLEKAFDLSSGALKREGVDALQARIPKKLPRLTADS